MENTILRPTAGHDTAAGLKDVLRGNDLLGLGLAVDDLTATMLAAMEQAAISGLCREGQLEIAAQEARKVRRDLSGEELLELAKKVYLSKDTRG
jgi:hypothetical protein